MNGMTLPRMSHDATPGYPAPEIAWSVVIMTLFKPNGRSGASAIESTTVEQFGFVTMRPFQPREAACTSSSARWSALISGMSSGTSASIR